MAEDSPQNISRFREILPQILASMANNFFRMNVSLTLGFATVVIAQLHNSDDPLSLDDQSASWLGSIAYICQPIGSVMSGVIVEIIGRKKFLMVLNIPFLLGLILLCFAPSFAVLMIAKVLIGVTVGFTQAPNMSYNGEVCETGMRGIMAANSGIFYQLGYFMQFLLGTLCYWRTAAGISTVIPISTFICVCMIPEVPIWLISKGRLKDAERSLMWLRGWVGHEAVKEELSEMVRYHKETRLGNTQQSNETIQSSLDNESVGFNNKLENVNLSDSHNQIVNTVSHTVSQGEDNKTNNYGTNLTIASGGVIPKELEQSMKSVASTEDEPAKGFSLFDVLKELIKPPTRRPLMLIIPFFFFVHFAGLTPIRPYMVLVFKQFHMPISAQWFTVVSGGCSLCGTILLMVFIRIIGKRIITLGCTVFTALAAICLGTYAYVHPLDDQGHLTYTWLPLVFIVVLSFCNSIVEQIPFILISEVYPFRTRGMSVGISVAFCYVFIFVTSKLYLDLEMSMDLYGAFWFYGCVSCVGFIFFYFMLLETEGKSLEEIERHFTLGLSAHSPEGRTKGRRRRTIRLDHSTRL